jgi:hypothetical protein
VARSEAGVEVAVCSGAGDEVVVRSRAGDEVAVCSEAGIKDVRWWRQCDYF